MKVIVGLGNPGEKYQYNRHNIGFMVVERLLEQLSSTPVLQFSSNKKFNAEIVQTKEYILAKPQTFMNDSGVSVAALVNFYKIKNEDIYIIHDDLDIKIGNYKIQHGKGPKVHNGLGSVEEKLGTDQFWNVRIGVENREVRGNKGIPGVVYSLQNFSPEERGIVDQVVGDVCEELLKTLQGVTS
jgi:PTH1 family peptidyl-tRNA hydrolase